jgi:hypothetical protein
MALTPIERFNIVRSIQGHLSAGNKTDREIVAAVGRKWGIGDPGEVLQVWNLLRSTKTAFTRAESLTDFGTGRLAPVQHPRDYGLYMAQEQFGYRVLITFTNPITGESRSTVVIVSSSTPLSGQEIAQAAQTLIARISIQGTHTNPNLEPNVNDVVELFILSAGQKP